MGNYSAFLFARPSFAEGMGRILDFGNTLTEYNRSQTGEQADMVACWMDWQAIADDYEEALERHRDVIKQSLQEKAQEIENG